MTRNTQGMTPFPVGQYLAIQLLQEKIYCNPQLVADLHHILHKQRGLGFKYGAFMEHPERFFMRMFKKNINLQRYQYRLFCNNCARVTHRGQNATPIQQEKWTGILFQGFGRKTG